jgi:penicillin amidase
VFKAYTDGINQYIHEAKQDPEGKLPKEFEAFGIELTRFYILDSIKIQQFVSSQFGLKGGSELENLAFYGELVQRHGEESARKIFDDILPQNDPDAYCSVPCASPGSTLNSSAGASDQWHLLRTLVSGVPRRALGEARSSTHVREFWRDIVQPASCGWVVSPKKSETGNVLMGISTADGAEAHLHGAGISASGYTFPGIPTLGGSGRTKHFVWQYTVGYGDQIDTYVETLHPEREDRYLYQGEWRQMERRTESIKVRGEGTVELEVYRTVHGPVVAWDPEGNAVYSVKSVGSDLEGGALSSFSAVIETYRAKSYEEYRRAVRSFVLNVGVLYGDDEGNIAYWYTGLHPRRPKTVDSRLPVPGSGDYEWDGYVPPDELPHVKNPRQGYLVSWNNKPREDWEGGDFGRWGKTHRVHMPVELIEADPSISWEDGLGFHETISRGFAHVGGNVGHDITKPDFFVPYILQAAERSADPRVKEAASHLEQWDGLHKDLFSDGYYDSVGLTIYRRWLPTAIKTIFHDDIGDFSTRIHYGYHFSLLLRALEGGHAGLPLSWDYFNGEDKYTVINRSLEETIDELTAEFGTEEMSKWKLPVFKRSFSTTMPGLATKLGFVQEIPENGAAAYTHLAELRKPSVKLVSVIPTGGQSWFIDLSGKPDPHLVDQVSMHASFQYKPMHFDLPDVLANAESKKILTVPHYKDPRSGFWRWPWNRN